MFSKTWAGGGTRTTAGASSVARMTVVTPLQGPLFVPKIDLPHMRQRPLLLHRRNAGSVVVLDGELGDLLGSLAHLRLLLGHHPAMLFGEPLDLDLVVCHLPFLLRGQPARLLSQPVVLRGDQVALLPDSG